jgi:Zn-dependent protease
MSVVIHEFAHGIAALWQGDPTAKLSGRLTLNPIKHIDPVGSIAVPLICAILPGSIMFGWAKPVPFNPYNLRNRKWGEAIVAGAGPLSNILIALILSLIIRFFIPVLSQPVVELFILAILTNLVLAIFNLVPLPPLDGSKILYSLFPAKMSRFIAIFERYGLMFTIIFIFAFVQVLDPIIWALFKLLVGDIG